MDSVPRPLPAGSYQVGGASTTPTPAQVKLLRFLQERE